MKHLIVTAITAPVKGLALVIFLPVIGFVLMAYALGKALRNRICS